MSQELETEGSLLSRFMRELEAGLSRASFEVSGEQVSLFVRGGKLRSVCTCGFESCEHLLQALRLLGVGAALGPSDARLRSSLRPPIQLPGQDVAQLADAFDELVLAIARAGVASPDSPSIREALDQVVARAPSPAPIALSRFVARVNESLASGDVGEVARMLEGAQTIAGDLRSGDRSARASARRRTWLSLAESGPVESLNDTTLVEVARERLSGLGRATIERRYFVELSSGEVLREERRRDDHDISVGPCPRVVHVAFAELESACHPRRVRLLQYTISAHPSDDQWRRVGEHALSSVSELGRKYVDAERACPGQSEPFVLFAPAALDPQAASMRDASGERAQLGGDLDEPLGEALRVALDGGTVRWIAGRLIGLARGLVLRPASALVERQGKLHLCRIT